MKRNSLFGAAAIFVAGAAIGGGAIVSQQAMATDTPEAATDSVTIGMVSSDGDAVQCTFTGADAADLMPVDVPGVPSAVEVGDLTVAGGSGGPAVMGPTAVAQSGGGSISGLGEVSDDLLPVLDGASGVATIEVDAASGGIALPAGGALQSREGTAEECEALRAEFVNGPVFSSEAMPVGSTENAPFIQGSTGVMPIAGGEVTP